MKSKKHRFDKKRCHGCPPLMPFDVNVREGLTSGRPGLSPLTCFNGRRSTVRLCRVKGVSLKCLQLQLVVEDLRGLQGSLPNLAMSLAVGFIKVIILLRPYNTGRQAARLTVTPMQGGTDYTTPSCCCVNSMANIPPSTSCNTR